MKMLELYLEYQSVQIIERNELGRKEQSFSHKLKLSNPHIFAT